MADIKKQIKDYDAVVSLATTDALITQQTADSICRKATPKQIIDLYSTPFAQTMLLLSNKAAWKTALDYLDLAQQNDAFLGTADTVMMTPLTTRYALEGCVPNYTNLASATTTSLASITQRYINITGTTDITSFGTGADGTYKYVKFTGSSLKITHGASLITVDGLDIKTQLNDTAELSCGSSNVWTIVKYTRANGLNLLHEELIAIIDHKESSGTAGGTFTSGAWRTRTLNTLSYNKYGTGTVSLGSNQFLITPTGTQTFKIRWSTIAFKVDGNQNQLYNITTSTSVKTGMPGYSASTGGEPHQSTGMATVTLSAATTFEIQHKCQTTASSSGFGRASS